MSGLPILSGHQPSFYHAGILAKRIALDHAADSDGTGATWLLADQDVADAGSIPYPDIDEEGNLVRRFWQVVPGKTGMPTCKRRWTEPTPPPTVSPDLPVSINDGLKRIHEALRSATSDLLGERIHEANEILLVGSITRGCETIRASSLLDSDPGREVLEKIAGNPRECAMAWNDAVRAVPGSARELRLDLEDDSLIEAPVWTVDEEGRRTRGSIADVRNHLDGGSQVLPRAFLMTALVRSAFCRLMIHGTGGAEYEKATDIWCESFLGCTLAPIRIVTATLRLPLEEFAPDPVDAPNLEDIRKLEHDPWADGSSKRLLVEEIRSAPRGTEERQKLFDEMHRRINHSRGMIEGRLSNLRSTREDAKASMECRQIAMDRTWPWPLHDDRALEELAGSIT